MRTGLRENGAFIHNSPNISNIDRVLKVFHAIVILFDILLKCCEE